jgi:hypothetical protein
MRRQTQAGDVERALVELGGYATLADLYKRIPIQNWGTKTPFATVRRILQMDSRFFRIRPGLWGLTAQRDLNPGPPPDRRGGFRRAADGVRPHLLSGACADDWQAARLRGFRAQTR